jgi:hypothetical protein
MHSALIRVIRDEAALVVSGNTHIAMAKPLSRVGDAAPGCTRQANTLQQEDFPWCYPKEDDPLDTLHRGPWVASLKGPTTVLPYGIIARQQH